MKKIWILFFSVFLNVFMFSQVNKDFYFLEKKIIKQDYLFHTIKKEDFKKNVQKVLLDKHSISRWKIDELLSLFKEFNLKTISSEEEINFLKIKVVADKIYIVAIAKEYDFLLEEQLVKIGTISINNLKKKLQQKFYLPNPKNVEVFLEENIGKPSFLNYLKCIKNDSLDITTKNFQGKIPVFSTNFKKIKIEKTLFKNRKKNVWFWSYGINFGQQLYLKFNHILSALHLKKMKDSLKWSNYKYAKTYHIPIQSTYNALKFIDLTNKLHLKFNNRRYKKLIIDFRNTKTGTVSDLNFFINHLKKIKRLHKKNKIYVLFNKHTNGASLKYIESLQKNFKPILVGEGTYGTDSDSNEIQIIELPISKIHIQIPIKHQPETQITPNIKVIQTLHQTKKGIDAILSKILE